MLDLNEQPDVPRFELKLTDGETKSYDTLLTSFRLKALDAEKDPTKIQGVINGVFEINVDAWPAMIILKEFTEFAEKNLEEPLKKVFGEKLYSAISMASLPKNSETSDQPSTSD